MVDANGRRCWRWPICIEHTRAYVYTRRAAVWCGDGYIEAGADAGIRVCTRTHVNNSLTLNLFFMQYENNG